ncbi:MAG TPA: PDZ domain-containing protein [Gemmatimonadales bacterium]|nr:PDZ domain-containing protein [Gemmatimonadales bacterium]
MIARWLAAALAAIALVPLSAHGQDPRRRVDATIPGDLAPNDQFIRMVFNRRARLGVNVNVRAQPNDSIGATIDAVTPGGPAAKAGLRAGDIITKLNGKSVLDSPDGPSERGQSLPGLRLIELAARLQPGDTVTIDYRRGGDRKTTTVVAGGDPQMLVRGFDGRRALALNLGDSDFDLPGDMMVPNPPAAMLLGGELAGLDLAPMNPDLGQYFGTGEGVLVVNAPKGSSLGLRPGDVVLAVDGRKPSGPSHLLRILRSYDRGESFRLDVLRNRKRETLTAHLGASREQTEQ